MKYKQKSPVLHWRLTDCVYRETLDTTVVGEHGAEAQNQNGMNTECVVHALNAVAALRAEHKSREHFSLVPLYNESMNVLLYK